MVWDMTSKLQRWLYFLISNQSFYGVKSNLDNAFRGLKKAIWYSNSHTLDGTNISHPRDEENHRLKRAIG